MKELCDFREAIHTIAEHVSDMLHGIIEPNTAGDMLDNLAEFLRSYEQAAVNVAIAAKPSTAADAEWRGWTILGFEADMTDSLASFAVLAAEVARDEAEAKFSGGRTAIVE